MKKTVYTVSQWCEDELLAKPENGDALGLCERGFRRYFKVGKMPCQLVLTDKPAHSSSALAVRSNTVWGTDIDIRYPELGESSRIEVVVSTFEQDEAIRAHQGPDGWAYVWVEVES